MDLSEQFLTRSHACPGVIVDPDRRKHFKRTPHGARRERHPIERLVSNWCHRVVMRSPKQEQVQEQEQDQDQQDKEQEDVVQEQIPEENKEHNQAQEQNNEQQQQVAQQDKVQEQVQDQDKEHNQAPEQVPQQEPQQEQEKKEQEVKDVTAPAAENNENGTEEKEQQEPDNKYWTPNPDYPTLCPACQEVFSAARKMVPRRNRPGAAGAGAAQAGGAKSMQEKNDMWREGVTRVKQEIEDDYEEDPDYELPMQGMMPKVEMEEGEAMEEYGNWDGDEGEEEEEGGDDYYVSFMCPHIV